MEIPTILRKYFVLFIIFFFKVYSYFVTLFFFLTKPNTLSVKPKYKIHTPGTSWRSQWLRLCASTARGTGLIPGQGTKISHAECDKKKLEKKIYYPLRFKFCKKKKRQLLILWHIQKLIFLLWIRYHIYITLRIKLDSVVLWLFFFFCLQVKLSFFTWREKNTEEIHQNLAKNFYTNFWGEYL